MIASASVKSPYHVTLIYASRVTSGTQALRARLQRDAYLKKVMLSKGLRASVKFAVVLYFVIVIRTANLRRYHTSTTAPLIQYQLGPLLKRNGSLKVVSCFCVLHWSNLI
jgi:hypothetical protein